MPVGKPNHPFNNPAAVDPFDSAQRIAHERHPPGDRPSNVGTQGVPVNARNRIAKRGYPKPAQ